MYNSTAINQFYSGSETVYDDTSLLLALGATGTGAHANQFSRHSLLQLIRQHQHQPGWILLVAPSHIPDKEWAEQYQLSLHNVLVIHQKQISDLNATLTQALTSSSCKVVINFARQLEQQQLDACRQLALCNGTWFYQCEHMRQEPITH
jgi:cell division inhibitor SulA